MQSPQMEKARLVTKPLLTLVMVSLCKSAMIYQEFGFVYKYSIYFKEDTRKNSIRINKMS